MFRTILNKIEERRQELREQDERRQQREDQEQRRRDQRSMQGRSWTAEDQAKFDARHPPAVRLDECIAYHEEVGRVHGRPVYREVHVVRRAPRVRSEDGQGAPGQRVSKADKRKNKEARRLAQRMWLEHKETEEEKERQRRAEAARSSDGETERRNELRVVRTAMMQRAVKTWKRWKERQLQLILRWSMVCTKVRDQESTNRKQVISYVVTTAKVLARLRAREVAIRSRQGGGQMSGGNGVSSGGANASSCNLHTTEGVKLGGILCVFMIVLCAGGGRWAVRTGDKRVTEHFGNISKFRIWRRGGSMGSEIRLLDTSMNECTRQRIGREQRVVAIEECGERDPG